MNAGIENKPKARQWKRRVILLILVVVPVAATWFNLSWSEMPQSRVEREIRDTFSNVRRQERRGSVLYSLASTLRQWPRPFPRLAEAFFGSDESDSLDPGERLAALGWSAVPTLTNALARDRSPMVRSTVASAFGEMGDPRLLPPLLAAYPRETDLNVQSSILEALGKIGDERAEPFLISVLQSTNDETLGCSAASALAHFQSPRVLTALTNALATTTNSSLRLSTIRALQDVPDDFIVPALVRALQSDADTNVRQSAADALANHPGDETVAALLEALRNDSDKQVRVSAARAVAPMTNSAVRRALEDALRQSVSEVRAAAANGLKNLPGESTETALLSLLASDPVADVRSNAAATLGALALGQTNQTVVKALIEALQNDDDPYVSVEAASALAQIGGDNVMTVLTSTLEKGRRGRVQAEAIGGLYRHQSPELTALLLRFLNGSTLDDGGRSTAISYLGYLRAVEAIPKLVALLKSDPEPSVREAAASALEHFDSKDAMQALRQALQTDTEADVRRRAASALGERRTNGEPATVSTLIGVLQQDGEAQVRAAAATALGHLRATNALAALLNTLQKDSDREVRNNAAMALGKLGRPEAAPRLEAALRKDRYKDVRASAAASLAAVSSTNHTQLFLAVFETDYPLRPELAGILGRLGSPEAVDAMLKALNEGGRNERAGLLRALGDAGDSRCFGTLTNLLATDRDPEVRASAATGLGRLGDPAALPVLEVALKDRAPSIRVEAAWALGHIGDPGVVNTLSEALNQRDDQTPFAAAYALAEIGHLSAAPALAALLKNRDDRTRLAAASALAFLGDSQGVEILAHKLHSQDTWQRFVALISLLRLNTPEVRRLLEATRDSDPTLAGVVEAGLRLGASASATNLLCQAQDNDSMTEDYRHFGARTLVFLKDPATLPALRANANDPREDVRVAVRVAIRRIESMKSE